MRDYTVECDYCEKTDVGLIDRTVRVTVRAENKFEAMRKVQMSVPCTVLWRFRNSDNEKGQAE